MVTNQYTNVTDFDYFLPEELIAKEATIIRDSSRLLVAKTTGILDLQFSNIIDYIKLFNIFEHCF